MRAIMSDVHGNLEALTAVLADVARQGVDSVYNLGDTTGYGPNPVECLDLVMKADVTLLGNFDHATLHEPDGFCIAAGKSVVWSRARLEAFGRSTAGRRRLDFLAGLLPLREEGDVLYVHASARKPLKEYIFPEDIYNPQKMERIGAKFDRICFGGHTHVPGVFLDRGAGRWENIPADECEGGFAVAGHKLICNVGSVGQPRDLDERACYVLFDGERIWFRRVAYDFEPTIRKIHAEPELDDFLGDRLREGR